METIAALYDIHGNAPALAAVLQELDALTVDAVVIGGDVFPGPLGPRCLELLADHPASVHYLRGNGDHDTLEASHGGPIERVPDAFKDTIRWCADDAGPAIEAVDSWPATVRLEVEGLGEVLFCHATPDDDNVLVTERTPEARLLRAFATADAGLVVCGHTHMQFDRRAGIMRIVNAGSIGMPFGEPGAYWALLSADGVELRRTEYDYAGAAREMATSSYPIPMNPALPPTAESMIAAFEAGAEDRA